MNQRGFGLIVYAVLALGILGMLAGIGYSIRKAGADAVRAELQPKLEACGAEVEKHNQAARVMAEESAKRQAAAAHALRVASSKAKVWEDNAAKLRDALTNRKPTDPQDCKAAWDVIRSAK